MGCGSFSKADANEIELSNKKTVHYLPVSIGNNVDCNYYPIIVFIFGGPGSKKSLIVDKVLSNFISCSISISRLIQNYNNKIDKIQLKDVDNQQADDLKLFNVDLLSFEDVMKDLEKEFPVSFALNLKVNSENIMLSKKNIKSKEESSKGDEVDLAKLQKRLTLHNDCISQILQYFLLSNRLIEIDTTGASLSVVWQSLQQVFNNLLRVFRKKHHQHILLFIFDDNDICLSISETEKNVGRITLRSLHGITRTNTSMELIQKLVSYINSIMDLPEMIIVDVRKTEFLNIGNYKIENNSLLFEGLQIFENYFQEESLDKLFMINNRKIFSTIDNYIFIFPNNIHHDMCFYFAQSILRYTMNN